LQQELRKAGIQEGFTSTSCRFWISLGAGAAWLTLVDARLPSPESSSPFTMSSCVHQEAYCIFFQVEGLRDVASLMYGWRADAADISRFYPGEHSRMMPHGVVSAFSQIWLPMPATAPRCRESIYPMNYPTDMHGRESPPEQQYRP